MSFINWLKNRLSSEAEHFLYIPIPTDRTEDKAVIRKTKAKAEEHYVRFWLSESFLAKDEKLFETYVPVVHSSVSLQFAGKPNQELPYIAGPVIFKGAESLGKGVQLNHALSNMLPFKGGVVSLAVGLFAYKEKDFLNSFINVLGGMASLLSVGQLSSTIKIVDTALAGIQDLFGAADKELHLLYFQSFGGEGEDGGVNLESGYTAIVRGTSEQINGKNLYVKDGQLLYGNSRSEAKPLKGYDYFLLRTEVTDSRDDALAFEEIADSLDKAIEAGLENKEEGKKLLKAAMVAVWSYPDFTRKDKTRIGTALKNSYNRAVNPVSALEFKEELNDLDQTVNRATNHVSALEFKEELNNLDQGVVEAANTFISKNQTNNEVPISLFLKALKVE